MNNEERYARLIARLSKEYEKKLLYMTRTDHIRSIAINESFLKRQFEIMKILRKNFKETEFAIKIGKYSYPAVISEASRKVLDLYVRGEFDGKDNN